MKPDFRKYSKAGQAVRAIFREFDADMESGSLDEAYLDITDYCQQHGMKGENPGILGDLGNLLWGTTSFGPFLTAIKWQQQCPDRMSRTPETAYLHTRYLGS